MTDPLAVLDQPAPLSDKLRQTHRALSERFPFIERLAFAAYDRKSDMVKTYLQYGPDVPIRLYEAKLSEAKSLRQVHLTGRARVVNDLAVFRRGRHEHTRRVAEMGYESSYTLPVRVLGEPCGFLFLNSRRKGVFTPEVLTELSVYGHLIVGIIASDLAVVRTLVSTVQAARDITDFRDEETGGHIERMARYARLIAKRVAPRLNLSDEFVENLFLFAPLHDVGKVAIPDGILRKAGRLSPREFSVMKTHTTKGRRIIEKILRDFGLEDSPSARMLRNIAHYHHEAMDGSGYPSGLKGESIPIEARITAVADVFDALTSRRRYKVPWSNRKAFATLAALSGKKLDALCVKAFLDRREEALAIRRRFRREERLF